MYVGFRPPHPDHKYIRILCMLVFDHHTQTRNIYVYYVCWVSTTTPRPEIYTYIMYVGFRPPHPDQKYIRILCMLVFDHHTQTRNIYVYYVCWFSTTTPRPEIYTYIMYVGFRPPHPDQKYVYYVCWFFVYHVLFNNADNQYVT